MVGVFSSRELKHLIEQETITSKLRIQDNQIQPASLDLRVGKYIYKVDGEFLCQNKTVQDHIDDMEFQRFEINDIILRQYNTYLVELQEGFNNNSVLLNHKALCNSKSSTGRLGINTRLITDYGKRFDIIETIHCKQKLYLLITPLAFDIVLRYGDSLHQMRITHVDTNQEKTTQILLDTSSYYESKDAMNYIEINKKKFYDPDLYWSKQESTDEYITLSPKKIYFMMSSSKVKIPRDMCAELSSCEEFSSEFRILHRGFFDPGFGEINGARATFEIIPNIPVCLRRDQLVARLQYEPMENIPEELYGADINSSYQDQELALSKQFMEKK